MKHSFPKHQVGYWVRRLWQSQATPALLPVRVVPSEGFAVAAVSLRGERGWTLPLPCNVPAKLAGRIDAGSLLKL